VKIGLIAPSPIPFTAGGAEKLWFGLQEEINENTSHQAELIKLPTWENSFWGLIDSYEQFWRLDVSHFDVVITGKYPGWMIRHPNHICYMLHRLRGFYDCFHFLRLPDKYVTSHPGILGLQELLGRRARSDEDIETVFSELRSLRIRSDIPADAWAFPGSLIREVVRFLDNAALDPARIFGYAAISKNVANRAGYFPVGVRPAVIYPPTNLAGLRCGEFSYVLTASRLDGPKRINLAIEAMRFVEGDIELRISGEGSEEARLRELAGDDPRIKFLGYRSEADLVCDYADALAVVFCPYDEDYGFITVEAMLSGKPVITTHDSGGPNEFVFDSQTGFSVPPDSREIANRINQLAQDRTMARRLGDRGRAVVANITWTDAATKLLRLASQKRSGPGWARRRKIVVTTTFPITPVRGGGQARILNLYKSLYPNFETQIVSLAHGQESFEGAIAAGVEEIRIPKSPQYAAAEVAISSEVQWIPVTDIVFGELAHLIPEYSETLARCARDADIVVASHPYSNSTIQQVCPDRPLWYEAQDVEWMLKKAVLPDTPRGRALIQQVATAERTCCDRAELIMACSESDAAQLINLYDAARDKIHVVPNGVDTAQVRYVSRIESAWAKAHLGQSNAFVAIFIGSWHVPNNNAAALILELAKRLPDLQFALLGSCGLSVASNEAPSNLLIIGEATPELKAMFCRIADVALNPIGVGSGTNLKMLDYAASGLPIISTPAGVRGLSFDPEAELFVEDVDSFAVRLQDLQTRTVQDLEARTARARQRVEREYDWRVIGGNFLAAIG
jgi:glycosyltransferase involved in cell wall biosynthesis